MYKNWPKVYKKYNTIDTRHEPKGGGGSQLGKTGPRREDNMGKHKSNHLISAKAPHRPTLKAQRRSLTEDGPIWPQLGVGRPLTGSVWPELWSASSCRLSKRRLHVLRRRLGTKDDSLLKIGRHARKHHSTPSPPSIL